MEYQCLTVEQQGFIRIVTFARPARANAVTYEFLVELEDCAHALREEAETRVVIFTGAGRHFCSGMDLDDARGYAGPMVLKRRRTQAGARAIRALQGIDQITIAAWNGAAMGGGACIATALDFRVGAEDCFMQYPEIDIGMNLMWQSLPLITHLVGPARAKRLVAGGERLHAPTLHAWGVLDEMVPSDALLPRALALADFYAGKPPVAVQMIKQSVNRIVSALDQSIMHMDADQNLFTRTLSDQAEALAAYRDGRPAALTGD
ncbi:MAG: enoyl-CoA hydratase/isomerase family protein [Gammaproteobacteria bacterium]